MLAEVVDAVVGGDTHRDTHALELTAPSGATIATLMIGNDERGFAEAIAWVAEHAPGPRVVVGLEGTRSYGIGLARVLQAAELTVVEIERPRRGERRRGKSDPIDAHLAALHLDADRLPTPRADGDREALRILLRARRELTTAKTRIMPVQPSCVQAVMRLPLFGIVGKPFPTNGAAPAGLPQTSQ
jgi:transposase